MSVKGYGSPCTTKGCSGHPLAGGLCVACYAHGQSIPANLISILKTDPHRTGQHPDLATTRQMYQRYQDGLSLAQVGQAFGVTRQAVYERFHRQGYPLRSRTLQESITYQGRKYTPGKNGYYRRTIHWGRNGRKCRYLQLHHEIWVERHGQIPEGHQVGFIDGDKTHLSIDNLICLPVGEMTRLHNPKHPTPVRYCEYCNLQLVRILYNSALETPSMLKRRRFCNLQHKVAFLKGERSS